MEYACRNVMLVKKLYVTLTPPMYFKTNVFCILDILDRLNILTRKTIYNNGNNKNGDKISDIYKYRDEQKITELGRSSISDAFSNFSFSSELPMTLAA